MNIGKILKVRAEIVGAAWIHFEFESDSGKVFCQSVDTAAGNKPASLFHVDDGSWECPRCQNNRREYFCMEKLCEFEYAQLLRKAGLWKKRR